MGGWAGGSASCGGWVLPCEGGWVGASALAGVGGGSSRRWAGGSVPGWGSQLRCVLDHQSPTHVRPGRVTSLDVVTVAWSTRSAGVDLAGNFAICGGTPPGPHDRGWGLPFAGGRPPGPPRAGLACSVPFGRLPDGPRYCPGGRAPQTPTIGAGVLPFVGGTTPRTPDVTASPPQSALVTV